TVVPLQQPLAQLLFHALYAATHRRRAEVHELAGLAEMECLGQIDEEFELAGIHGPALVARIATLYAKYVILRNEQLGVFLAAALATLHLPEIIMGQNYFNSLPFRRQ